MTRIGCTATTTCASSPASRIVTRSSRPDDAPSVASAASATSDASSTAPSSFPPGAPLTRASRVTTFFLRDDAASRLSSSSASASAAARSVGAKSHTATRPSSAPANNLSPRTATHVTGNAAPDAAAPTAASPTPTAPSRANRLSGLFGAAQATATPSFPPVTTLSPANAATARISHPGCASHPWRTPGAWFLVWRTFHTTTRPSNPPVATRRSSGLRGSVSSTQHETVFRCPRPCASRSA